MSHQFESEVVYVRPRFWLKGKRRREAWIALLAHSLQLLAERTHGVGSERIHNYDSARRQAKRLLSEPEVQKIRRSFNDVALADVLDDLRRVSAGSTERKA